MIENKWFCEPDDQRECWCFLILHMDYNEEDFNITGWEIGYSNPRKIVRKIKNSKSNEKQIIKELLHELYYCRKNRIILITFGVDVFPAIRTRIILMDLKDASLRRIKYISVEKLIAEYFLFYIFNSTATALPMIIKRMNIANEKSSDVEMLWKIFLRIGPVLPDGVI